MKLHFKILIIYSLVVSPLFGQWEQVSEGLYGADVSCLEITDSNIYAGTYSGGIFMSRDKGINWENISNSMFNKQIIDLTITNGYIFAATEFEFQFTSNNGDVWQIIKNENISDISSVNSINNFIFAGDRNTGEGFWYSSNYGQSWEQRINGLVEFKNNKYTSFKQIENIFCEGKNIFLGTLNFLYHSTNNGLNWKQIKYDSKYHSVDKIIFTEHEIILLTSRTDIWGSKHKLFRAKLDELIFRNFGKDLFEENITDIAYDNGKFFASTRSGVFLSTDLGNTWSKKNNLLEINNVYFKNNLLFITTWNDGLYRSTDDGYSFSEVTNGLFGVFVGTLINLNGKILAGTSKGNFNSDNSGLLWKRTPFSGFKSMITSILKVNEDELIGTFDEGIYYSSNNGSIWSKRSTNLQSPYINKIIKSNDKIFAATGLLNEESGLYYSTNLGTNWVKCNFKSKDYSVHDVISYNNVLFIGTHSDGVFRSSDNGEFWEQVSKGLDNYISRIEFLFNLNNKIYAFVNSKGLYVSEDMGDNWFKIIESPSDIRCVVINNNNVYAGTYYHGILMSNDGCKTWKNISTNTLLRSVWSLTIKDNYLFAGTNSNGIWRYRLE